jgi:hypothetical protein
MESLSNNLVYSPWQACVFLLDNGWLLMGLDVGLPLKEVSDVWYYNFSNSYLN